jgi:hypothetical protein
MSHRPGNSIGVGMTLLGIAAGLLGVFDSYVLLSGETDRLRGAAWAAWLTSWLWVPVFVAPISLLFLFCPDGRLPSFRWRPVVYLDIATMALLMATQAVNPGPIEGYSATIRNPLGIEAFDSALFVLNYAGYILLIPVIGLSGAAMVRRFRGSKGRERQQLKWFALAAVGALAIFIASWPIGYVGPDPWDVSTGIAISLVPIAAGIAILRHNLYDIDRIVSRTLAYALLTAGLATIYFGLVVGLQQLLEPVSGGSDLAIVATTLVVAALSLPARRRVQRLVDRRFNRHSYDAQRTIEAFGARLREQIDLDTLRYELLAVVDETMQPSTAALWLRNGVRS